MAASGKQVGGRAFSYLTVRRGRPPASYGSGHGTTKRYAHRATIATEASMDMNERLGRLREPRYLLLYLAGGALSALAAVTISRYTHGTRPELVGAVFIGGVAVSAQLAKDRFRRAPTRAWFLVGLGLLSGPALGALAR